MASTTNNQETVSDNSVALPTGKQSRARLRYLATFVGPHKREFIASVLTAIVTTICTALTPFLLKHTFQKGLGTDGGSTGSVNHGQLLFWLSIIVVVVLIQWVAAVLNTVWSVWSVRVVNDLRTALYAHIQRQGLDFFSRQRTGTVISRLTNDIEALSQLVTEGVFVVFVNMLTVVLIEAFMFAINVQLAVVVNIIFPMMLAATITFRYYSTRAYRRTRELMAHVTAYVAESLSGMRVMQAFAAEERAAVEFERTNTRYRRANMETIWLSAAYFPGVEFLGALGTVIVLLWSGHLGSHGDIKAPVIVAFILYIDNFFDPINQLSQFYGSYLSAMAALDKIMGVMETEPTINDAPDARTLDTVRGEVTIADVNFRYDADGPLVLQDVNLHVSAGETIALVGHTGAGKSTFVKLLSRFYDPSSGSVELDGVDVRQLKQRWLRRTLGIVPQEGFLFSGSVRDNIVYGDPTASDERVREAAHTVGADHFIEQLEHGYDTQVGERGSRLSAGQRQLVAFARALLVDPRVLVLDEATSSVDVETELRLADGLRALVDGRTAFIVAHRLSTIRDADRIVVIDDGRIVEQGTHDELLVGDGFYAGLYGAWSTPEE